MFRYLGKGDAFMAMKNTIYVLQDNQGYEMNVTLISSNYKYICELVDIEFIFNL